MTIYQQLTWHNTPEDLNLQQHTWENLESRKHYSNGEVCHYAVSTSLRHVQ